MDWWLVISYLGVFAVGGYAGYAINDWVIRRTFGEMMAEAGLTDDRMDQFIDHWQPIMDPLQPTDMPRLQIRIEKLGDQIMCYEKASNQFLAQARTQDELIDILTQRLGPVTLLIEPEDGADLVKEGAGRE
jgi:hypothetical protein